jgi:hypothetical protein
MGTPLLKEEYRKPTGEPYLSGTEWEFEEALGARCRPDILVYRRTEQASLGLDDPKRDEKIAQWERVTQFFDRFRNPDGSLRGSVTKYDTPSAFAERLKGDLRELIAKRLEQQPASPKETSPPRPLRGRPRRSRGCGPARPIPACAPSRRRRRRSSSTAGARWTR